MKWYYVKFHLIFDGYRPQIHKILSKNSMNGRCMSFLRLFIRKQIFEGCGTSYIFSITSTKNSVSLLEICAEPLYFSATAAIAASPIPFPLCFVEW